MPLAVVAVTGMVALAGFAVALGVVPEHTPAAPARSPAGGVSTPPPVRPRGVPEAETVRGSGAQGVAARPDPVSSPPAAERFGPVRKPAGGPSGDDGPSGNGATPGKKARSFGADGSPDGDGPRPGRATAKRPAPSGDHAARPPATRKPSPTRRPAAPEDTPPGGTRPPATEDTERGTARPRPDPCATFRDMRRDYCYEVLDHLMSD